MTDWRRRLMNPQFLDALYGDAPPSLRGVVCHEVVLHRDGPVLRLRFDLPDFPARPPSAWVARQANVAQVTLTLIGVTSVAIAGWSTHMQGDLAIDGAADGGLRLRFAGAHVRVEAEGVAATVEVTPYTSRDPAAP